MTQKIQEELPDFQTSALPLTEIIYLTKGKNTQYIFTEEIKSFQIKLMKNLTQKYLSFIHSMLKQE